MMNIKAIQNMMTQVDFDANRPDGQMLIEERMNLFGLVLSKEPETIFETGTHTGRGSTYYLALALSYLGQGSG